MRIRRPYLPCFAALWFSLTFATPLFVSFKNVAAVHLGLAPLVGLLAALTVTASLLTHELAARLPDVWYRRVSLMVLALAAVAVVQGNFVHELFDYGSFNGEPVRWEDYGWKYRLEGIAYLVAAPLFYLVLRRSRKPPRLLPALLLVSSGLLLAQGFVDYLGGPLRLSGAKRVDPRVFEFSSSLNLIHLLPDAFQGDLVREVLETHPRLAARFNGFVFFDNHVGAFQGTGPSVPTMLTGRRFDLDRGHDFNRLRSAIDRDSYPRVLQHHGFRLDYVAILKPYCIESADSCEVRPFNDLKARGYFAYGGGGLRPSLAIVADLTLFRHVPMMLKRRVYNEGYWLFSDTNVDGSSRYPDPVLREWTDRMVVADKRPRYKWYHYIGTHIPPQWTAECVRVRGLKRTRANYRGQTLCELEGIARFLDRLKEAGIYDETAMVITGDHGCNAPERGMVGEGENDIYMHPGFFGTARPVFMVKRLGARAPLSYSTVPTDMTDVAPTALALVGLSGDYPGRSALDSAEEGKRTRVYQRYESRAFWSGQPIPYVEYHVDGDSRDRGHWHLAGLHNMGRAPSGYPKLAGATARRFILGLDVSKRGAPNGVARLWGREFAFLISLPARPVHRLAIRLHLSGAEQAQVVSIHVNRVRLPGPYFLAGGWSTLRVPVRGALFKAENNFVQVTFSGPGASGRKAAKESVRIDVASIQFD